MNEYWVPETPPPADFELPHEQGRRIRHDYYETLTDLYVDEHLKPFIDWSAEQGVKFRTQAAFGQNLDVRAPRELAQPVACPTTSRSTPATWSPTTSSATRESGASPRPITARSSAARTRRGPTRPFRAGRRSSASGPPDGTSATTEGCSTRSWAAGTSLRDRPRPQATRASTRVWPGDIAFGAASSPTESERRDLPAVGRLEGADRLLGARHHRCWRPAPRAPTWRIYRDGFITTAAQGFTR